MVIDYSDGRVSLWDSEGKHVRTFARLGFIPLNGVSMAGSASTGSSSSSDDAGPTHA